MNSRSNVRDVGWECDHYKNEAIYRVVRAAHLIKMIETGRSILVSPELWADQYDDWPRKLHSHLGFPKEERPPVYVQCWSTKLNESLQWPVYSPQLDGVRVQSTTDLLKESAIVIGDYRMIGKVQYRPAGYFAESMQGYEQAARTGNLRTRSFIYSGPDALRRLMRSKSQLAEHYIFKRNEFGFEKEIRLVHAPPHCGDSGNMHAYSIDPKRLIQEIVLDPRMPRENVEALRNQLCTLGFGNKIKCSHQFDLSFQRIGIQPGPIS